MTSGWRRATGPMSSGDAFGVPQGQPLVGADRRDVELHGLADEPLPQVPSVAVVEPPDVAVALERPREVRERLPRRHRIAPGGVLHRVQRRRLRAHVRERLRVQQDPLVAAESLHGPARDVHDLRRQRAALREDREGREHEHVRVRAEEHQLEEVLDRVADARVVLPAPFLRERLPEALAVQHGIQVVLEEVTLDVEHELLAAERLVGARRLDRGARRDLVGPARLARGRRRVRSVRLTRAGVEGQERRRRAARGEQELPSAHAEPAGVALGVVAGSPDRLLQDGREDGFRIVFRVGHRAELDREPGVLLPVFGRSSGGCLGRSTSPPLGTLTGARPARFP